MANPTEVRLSAELYCTVRRAHTRPGVPILLAAPAMIQVLVQAYHGHVLALQNRPRAAPAMVLYVYV